MKKKKTGSFIDMTQASYQVSVIEEVSCATSQANKKKCCCSSMFVMFRYLARYECLPL